jgi:hypothetical protein
MTSPVFGVRFLRGATQGAAVTRDCAGHDFVFPQSQRRDSNPQPQLYKSRALPLSYAGGSENSSLSVLVRGVKLAVR